MRLGMSGCFLPADMNDIDSAMCRRVRAAGFGGIFTRFRGNDPLGEEHDLSKAVRCIGWQPRSHRLLAA